MSKRKRFVIFILVTGFLLTACSFPTWLASEISEFISPYLPTATELIQQPATETVQPEPSHTNQPVPTQTSEPEAVQVIDRTFFAESDDPRYEIDGVWPNLEGPDSVTAAFNVESDRMAQEVIDDFLLIVSERALESEGSGEAPLSTLTFNYDLTYSDSSIFSFYLLFDQYIAMSAHPFSFSNPLNYDAQEGEFIRLVDLFLPGVDHIGALESYIDPVLIGRGFGYEAGTAGEVMIERENWNLLPEGLRINFDVYEVAPYAAGPQYILIPWGDLIGILDLAGPAGSFIE